MINLVKAPARLVFLVVINLYQVKQAVLTVHLVVLLISAVLINAFYVLLADFLIIWALLIVQNALWDCFKSIKDNQAVSYVYLEDLLILQDNHLAF
jgi:hypothetical protein